MSAINWTDEQRAVIESIDSNTLVSASAGSGKTAVMLERVMRLIVGDAAACRAPVPLRKIMMVTFNESVAAELKSKINSSLVKLIDSGKYDRTYLARQIEDIPLCDVSTLHSFCNMLIKSNFERLDIQPSYSIVDESERQTLFSKAIANCLKKYKSDYDYQMDVLINYFGGERSFEILLGKIYSFLEAQLDREGFLRDTALSSYSPNFKNTPLAKSFMQGLHLQCVDLLTEGYGKLSYFDESSMEKRAAHIKGTLDFLEKLDKCKDIEELNEVVDNAPKTPNLPPSKKDDVDRSVGADFKKFNDKYKDFLAGLKKIFVRDRVENQAVIDKCRPHVERLVDIVRAVDREYSRLKRKDNKMDFADLEYYALRLLQDDGIAEEVAGKYEYVCVDEYQDINAVQDYILRRVSNGKNLFMVGDVKQSIYQFRMTDPQIFLSKYREYKEDNSLGAPHSLNRNYRSCKEVIDFVNEVFDRIMTEDFGGIDYRRESRLTLGNTDYKEQLDMPVRITSFSKNAAALDMPLSRDGVYSARDSLSLESNDVYEEGAFIAEQISSLVGKKLIQATAPDGSMQYRPISFSDIALLCPKRSDGVEKIIKALKSVGIPVDSANIVNEKSNPCVDILIDLIRTLDNHRQDIPLVAMLTCKVFSSLTYADMAKIKAEYRGEKFFCDAVIKYSKDKSDAISKNINDFFALLDRYRFAAGFMSVSALIRRILADVDFRSYALSREDGESEYAALERFVSKLEGKPYNASVSKFVEAADSVADFGKVAGESCAQGDFVRTSTIHASKGLEYPVVFLIDTAKQVNLNDVIYAPVVYDKRFGFAIRNINDLERSYDASLPMELIKTYKSKELLEEYMRLFYVAATRARNRLYLTATTSKKFAEKRIANPKCIWDWLNNVAVSDGEFLEKYYFYPEEVIGGEEEVKDIVRKPVDKQRLRAFADMLDSKYAHTDATKMLVKHTVTAINNEYFSAQSKFYDKADERSENLVEMLKNGDEEQKADVLSRADEGIAYHRALECIDYDCFSAADVERRLEEMVSQGLLSAQQREVVDAQSVLECLQSDVMCQARQYPHYREKQFMLNVPAYEIMDTPVQDKVLLQGTVDLFIKGKAKGGENILVDFKFSHKSEEQIARRYRRQIQLYSTAIEECLGEKVDRKVIFVLGRNLVIDL